MNRISTLGLVAALAFAGAAAGALAARSTGRTTTVHVTEREYHIALSAKSLPAGNVVLVVHNAGKIAHRLSISGPGLSTKTTPTIKPGATRSLTVKLGGGSFSLWCPIPGHAALGMKTALTLKGPVAGGTPPVPVPMPMPTDPGYGGGNNY